MNNPNRLPVLQIELTKLFLSNNRPSNVEMITAKANMISETLKGLPTENLIAFFEHVRNNVDGLPTDARILKEYRGTVKKFGPQLTKNQELSRLPESNDHFKSDGVFEKMKLPSHTPDFMLMGKRR